MKATRGALAALVVLVLAGPSLAAELGEKAPPLTIKEWVKGKPVDVTAADGKHVYVVEFWATWCGPCRIAIPHMTEMQKEYKDKNVVFIGVSTDDQRTVAQVKPFVEKEGDKMDYTVAIDKDGATAKAYMDAFGIRGIPHAFVINQKGQIIWHDHPMVGLEEVLDKVVAGEFDLAAAKKLMAQRDEERRKVERAYKLVDEYFRLVQSAGKEKEAAELGKKVLDAGQGQAELMNDLAWNILTREGIVTRDLKLALVAAEAADKGTKGEEPGVLDTYALALFENGQKSEALTVQRKAVELAKKKYPDSPEIITELTERLERYKKANE